MAHSHSASLGSTDYGLLIADLSQFGMLGLRYQPVKFGTGKSLVLTKISFGEIGGVGRRGAAVVLGARRGGRGVAPRPQRRPRLPRPPRTGSADSRKVDIRLPGKGNSNSHGARPVHLTITDQQLVNKELSLFR